jgi:hypothetical protein
MSTSEQVQQRSHTSSISRDTVDFPWISREFGPNNVLLCVLTLGANPFCIAAKPLHVESLQPL